MKLAKKKSQDGDSSGKDDMVGKSSKMGKMGIASLYFKRTDRVCIFSFNFVTPSWIVARCKGKFRMEVLIS